MRVSGALDQLYHILGKVCVGSMDSDGCSGGGGGVNCSISGDMLTG